MAWRIDESVIRGEIDNRTRGRVTGRIWFVGRAEPVELDLAGNAWRDLAGRRLEFVNPTPKADPHLVGLAVRQSGVIGDCTASRKVKVPDIPMDQIGEYYAAKKPWTWHWGNSLYLEWFSATNGRVVIESVSFQLTIAPEIAWEMTAAEEEQQRRANAEAMSGFMEKLDAALSADPAVPDDAATEASHAADSGATEAELDSERPLSEAEAEQMHEESERLVDRIQARLEREGDEADFAQIIREELERRRRERGEAPPTAEDEAQRAEWLDEMNRASEALEYDADSAPGPRPEHRHPVAEQAYALTVRLMQEPDARGWIPAEAGEEYPLVDLAVATSKASAKLAGALNGEDWPPPVDFCATHLVRLKRARGYFDDALLAAECCLQQQLGDPAWIQQVQRELTSLAHACDALIGELRALLERGFD
ncbi:hypothetical protein [Opitutus terrae]|uniref:Uncharacterized protein n=1 Tax=Opitutus terrae (strain DSM 11246 / JCM 15787 / PB90-1) TaxID=452637 RepID=B1ZXQ9_OPITP|nr:hypothetical protein [Opitutus terrae]ACB74281.1 hypothetical protein Oter_0993 [Opitutus terrae PB90-1]